MFFYRQSPYSWEHLKRDSDLVMVLIQNGLNTTPTSPRRSIVSKRSEAGNYHSLICTKKIIFVNDIIHFHLQAMDFWPHQRLPKASIWVNC